MKTGDKINCPHCGQETVLKEKVAMDGWKQTGKFLGCAICGVKIADLPELKKSDSSSGNVSSLAALLGTTAESAPVITKNDGEQCFCRDCIHFVRHPFLNRCELHSKNVNPMDDCPDFKAAPKPAEEK